MNEKRYFLDHHTAIYNRIMVAGQTEFMKNEYFGIENIECRRQGVKYILHPLPDETTARTGGSRATFVTK